MQRPSFTPRSPPPRAHCSSRGCHPPTVPRPCLALATALSPKPHHPLQCTFLICHKLCLSLYLSTIECSIGFMTPYLGFFHYNSFLLVSFHCNYQGQQRTRRYQNLQSLTKILVLGHRIAHHPQAQERRTGHKGGIE